MNVYLASPYSHPAEDVRERRAVEASIAAGRLMERGLLVFAPISMGHAINKVTPRLPTDYKYWQALCEWQISNCDAVVVLTLHGWKASVGVMAEVAYAKANGKQLFEMDPWTGEMKGFES